ncbi:MAG: PSD1 and planctomycete cytochrome C domain-containing protein [Verrucomicrobiales bacterium]
MQLRLTLIALLSICAGEGLAAGDHAADMAESLSLFKSEVREILVENCVKCHGGEKIRSEYDLTTRTGLLAGGDIGVPVIAGDAKQSPLFDYLEHREEPFMPPKKPRLPEQSIAAIAKWIDLGAAYDEPLTDQAKKPGGPMQVTDAERDYWAFAPLLREFPEGASIDHFIRRAQVQNGLTPAPPAPKRTLIRRAYFDLTGLPPEPEAIDRFVTDDSPDAYAGLVDQLLASPRFGERWARHWLDVARFAESHGFEHDYDRKFAFHYRDFVVRAFNQDMPYDQFTRWQIAGDEIAPDDPLALMATGFLGAGVYPTQITISEAERIRYDAMDDMLGTVGSAMLATTVACARCHDHKYDPIPTRDYYRMLSTFKTTVRTEVDVDLGLLDPESSADYQGELAQIQKQLADYESSQLGTAFKKWWTSRNKIEETGTPPSWVVLEPDSLTAPGGVVFEKQPDGSHLATGANPQQTTYTFSSTAPLAGATAIRLEALAHPSMKRGGPGRAGNGNIQLTGIECRSGDTAIELVRPRATFQQNEGNLAIASAIDGNSKTGWALDPQFGKDHAAIFEIGTGAEIPPGSKLSIKLKFEGNGRHTIGRPRLSISNAPPATLGFAGQEDPRLVAERKIEQLMERAGGGPELENEAAILEQFKIIDPEYQALLAGIAKLEDSRREMVQKVMICSEGSHVKPMRHHTSSGRIPDFYEECYQLNRGDSKQKLGLAEPGFLQVLTRGDGDTGHWPSTSKDGRTSGDRSALSHWLTDVDHGAGHLLARVIVNRLWQHHFGRGIVATPNDFGFQGDRPTHPELLDWLAGKLIDSGWRLKPLHKMMLMSEAYRMGELRSEANQQADRENRFLWHRPPRRLEGEAIRDNALAVGGLLDETMYGAGTLDERSRRRSLYFMVKRSKLVPTMQMFDWPDTLTSLGRRAVTTTPSQALIFINHPQFREMSKGFAQRLSGVADPIATAYMIAYGRPPSGPEHRSAEAFVQEQRQSHDGDLDRALTDFCAALMSANEFIYID